nr:uncharacterized protein I303_03054 [Kwoniella dejecticola CBS 10117]OBR87032.1 hypothetical protein I303_03054 [Kwoniella dejecticola CBS 10117]
MSEYSKASSSSSNNIINSNSSVLAVTTNPVISLATSSTSRNPYAAPTARSASTTTVEPIVERSVITVPTRRDTHSPLEKGTHLSKRAEEDTEEIGEANFGLSSVPRHGGGVVFTVLSRLIMVATLSVLLIGQLGWPEMFLHDHIPWLGPQRTPIWLGLVQSIVAVESLRVYAKITVLVPSYALLVIGLLNLSISTVLIYLGRKLPKQPPAPLYFNHAVRVLYFLPPPKCYNPILKRDVLPEATHGDEPEAHPHGDLPPSNSKSIGLDSDDDDDLSIRSEVLLPIHSRHSKKTLDNPVDRNVDGNPKSGSELNPKAKPKLDLNPFASKEDYKDVSKGGYPTFTGTPAGLVDPSRQVPTGFIERTRDGRKIEFINSNPNEPDSMTGQGQSVSTDQGGKTRGIPANTQTRDELPPRGQSKSKKRAMTAEVPKHLFQTDNSSNRPGGNMGRERADSVDTITPIRGKTINGPVTPGTMGKVDKDRHGDRDGSGLSRKPTFSTMTFGPTVRSPVSAPESEAKRDSVGIALKDILLESESKRKSGIDARLHEGRQRQRHGQRQSTSSFASATREMGPRFPFPPSRQTSLRRSTKAPLSTKEERDEMTEEDNGVEVRTEKTFEKDVFVEMDSSDTKARMKAPDAAEHEAQISETRESKGPRPPFRAGSKRSQNPRSTEEQQHSHRRSKRDSTYIQPESLSLDTNACDSKAHSLDSDDDPYESHIGLRINAKSPRTPKVITLLRGPKSPKSPKSPKVPLPRPQPRRRSSSSSSSASPKYRSSIASKIVSPKQTRKRAATLSSPSSLTSASLPSAPSSSLSRSISAKSARGARTARGVRFNLSPTRENDVEDEQEDEDGGNDDSTHKKSETPDSGEEGRLFRDSQASVSRRRARSKTLSMGDERDKKGGSMVLGGTVIT